MVLFAGALVAVGVTAAVVRGGTGAGEGERPAAAQASPSGPLVRVAAIRPVHRGAPVTVRYRVEGGADGTVEVRLSVTSPAGQVVKTLRLGEQTTGARHTARFGARWPAGPYTCTVTAGDGAAASEPLQVLAKLPRRLPDAAAVESAVDYLKARSCESALAVVDTRGEVHGYDLDEKYTSASVVKAMLLVQYLRTHDSLSDDARGLLASMITESDNDAAYAIHDEVGARGLRRLADQAGMKRFKAGDDVLHSTITAADQARFFWAMDDYVPKTHRAFARSLLSGICASQTWGVAEVARPEWRVYFKSGWFNTGGRVNALVNQVARLERDGLVWSVAVLTDDNPTDGYAFETLREVTRLLLAE